MQITDITPYLPFYLGCDFELYWRNDKNELEFEHIGKLISIQPETKDRHPLTFTVKTKHGYYTDYAYPVSDVIPHLRPFSQFTVDDLKGWHQRLKELGAVDDENLSYMETIEYKIKSEEIVRRIREEVIPSLIACERPNQTPHLIAYLCSRSIDVFSLIESGLAKIKKEEGK